MSYQALPTNDPGSGMYNSLTKSLTTEEVLATMKDDETIYADDVRYRAELDFDGSGEIDKFELFFGQILDRAKEGKKVPLTDDVWGCAIYTTVTDLPAIMACQMTYENVILFGYISLMSLINLTLQFGLLYWISVYVMAPSMRSTQDTYYGFHRDAFSADGAFSDAQFETFHQGEHLCQFPLFDRWFMCSVLFLWASQCFIEIRSSQRIFSGLISLPSLPWGISHNLMIHEGLHESDSHDILRKIEYSLGSVDDNVQGDTALLAETCARLYELVSDKFTEASSEKYLVCLTPLTRISIFALVLVPRMIIILSLMFMGCVWLISTDRFDSLILNALALEFVVNVDNLLFTMFFPVSLHSAVENLKVAMPVEVDKSALTDLLEDDQDDKAAQDLAKKITDGFPNTLLDQIFGGSGSTEDVVKNGNYLGQAVKKMFEGMAGGAADKNGYYHSPLWRKIATSIPGVTNIGHNVLKRVKDVLPITVSLDHYVGLDIELSWPQSKTGKRNKFPDVGVSVYTLNQKGITVTLGDLTLAATLGGWISDTNRVSFNYNRYQSELASAPEKGDIVEFWRDPEDDSDVGVHKIGVILSRRDPVPGSGDPKIYYNILVRGTDSHGRLTDKQFQGGREPEPFYNIPHTQTRLSTADRQQIGECATTVDL